MSAKAALDWKALQRALVFTKLVYRKPAGEDDTPRRLDRPAPTATAAESAGVALAVAPAAGAALVPAARVTVPAMKPVRREVAAGAAAAAADIPFRHVDAFGTTDERLLPWACD